MFTHIHRVLFSFVCLLALLGLGFVACDNKPTYPYDSCERDTDCKSDKICRGGRCEQVDLTCTTDGDCIGGRLCIKAKCQHPVCQDDRDCSAGETCIGGFCGATNEEVPPTETGTPDAATETTTPDTPPSETPIEKIAPSICTPNNNGQIDREELLFKVGTSITYQEAGSDQSPITVDLNGTRGADGEITWDFSQSFPNSTKVVDELLPLDGTWYAGEFGAATHAVILDRSLKFFGVFAINSTDLLLQGVVSENKGSTLLKYDTPISLFKFPLDVGQKWSSTGTASGTLNSVPFYKMLETYLFEVDAKGKVITPAGTFPVVRLKLDLTQQQLSPTFFRRTGFSYYFIAECYGVLVTVDSKTYESNPLFTQAARIKRLSQ